MKERRLSWSYSREVIRIVADVDYILQSTVRKEMVYLSY